MKPTTPPTEWTTSIISSIQLRDLFAAFALAGLLADTNYNESEVDTAFIAYGYADAMLAEREKKA